jgi:hypothetical protein
MNMSWKMHTQMKRSCKITVSRKKIMCAYTGVPRGNVNILEGHNIGHSNQKCVYVN